MSWRWFVADGVSPRPGTREALEAAAERVPDARIVAARVQGGADPLPELFRRDRALRAARARLLAVRAVPPGCLLVRDDVLAAHGEPPRVPWDLSWSTAALRDGNGYLVPDAWADAPPVRTPWRSRARLVLLPGLTATERLWLAYIALRALRPA